MAKTMDTTPSSVDGTKKQRKKQAKREAKTMLKLEESRKDLQKAEQKLARAQAQLEASRTRLHNLEAEIEKMHTSPSDSEADTTGTSQQRPTQTEGNAYISTPANQVASLPPAEGRTDVIQDESNSSDSAVNNGSTSQGEETTPTDQVASLPPAEGRTDISQDQETTSEQAANNGGTSQEQESSVPPETPTAWHPAETWEQAAQAEEVPHDGAGAEDIHEATEQ